MLRVACCGLHVAGCMLRVACCGLHVAGCMLHVACFMFYVACWLLAVCIRSWDAWLDLIEPIASRVPYLTTPGNHETGPFDLDFLPYLHRFPQPWDSDFGVVLNPLERDTADGGFSSVEAVTTAKRSQMYYRYEQCGDEGG